MTEHVFPEDWSDDLVFDISDTFALRGDSIYIGAVELTDEQCRKELWEIVSDACSIADVRRAGWDL